ncbi:von Willebrand factor A domain-containing protein 7, partial [Biomphalaria pfeifferi]
MFCRLHVFYVVWLWIAELSAESTLSNVTTAASLVVNEDVHDDITRSGAAWRTQFIDNKNGSVSSSRTDVQSRSESQLLCRPQELSFIIQPHTVTLLRISALAIQALSPDTPFQFNVDSTIYKLLINVQENDPLPPKLMDPSGMLVSARRRRSFSTEVNIDQRRRTINVQTPLAPQVYSSRWSTGRTRSRLQNTADNRNVTSGRFSTKNFFSNFQHHKFRTKDPYNLVSNRINYTAYTYAKYSQNSSIRKLRAAAMYQLNPGLRQWQIDMPDAGSWTLNGIIQNAKNITVLGFTELDFVFEFLDYHMQKLELPPIAHDPCIVTIHMTSLICLFNITRVDLYDDLGKVLLSSPMIDPNLQRTQQSNEHADAVSVQAMFFTPAQPFYLCICGYDARGNPFQRLSSIRVVPRLFAMSVPDNFTKGLPFSPTKNDTFKLWIRNEDQDASIKITVQFDNEFVTGKVRPTILKWMKSFHSPMFQSTEVTVVVSPELKYPTTVSVNLTATRTLDGLTETLLETISVVPEIYALDRTAPFCRVLSSWGGCRPDIACHLQQWGVDVLVADNATGVSSADFVNAPAGSITDVLVSYSSNNETAVAKY